MTNCKNCGAEIQENDSFCPECGTKTSQSPIENQNKEKVDQAFEHVISITKEIDVDEIITTLKTTALNPVSGGKVFVDKAKKNYVIIITVVLALLQGILGAWRTNQIISVSQGGFDFDSFISIPYGKIFFGSCLIYLVAVFVLFIYIYLGIRIIAKGKCTSSVVFKSVLISSLPILTCQIISILLSYFSLYLGIGFIILGALMSITTLTVLVREGLEIKDNLCIFIVSLSFLILFTSFYIVGQNILSSELSYIFGDLF